MSKEPLTHEYTLGFRLRVYDMAVLKSRAKTLMLRNGFTDDETEQASVSDLLREALLTSEAPVTYGFEIVDQWG